MTATCVDCGKLLSTKRARRCRPCMDTQRRRPAKNCVQCGRSFWSAHPHQRFCSNECKFKTCLPPHRQAEPAGQACPLPWKTCPTCKAEHYSRKTSYCSAECRPPAYTPRPTKKSIQCSLCGGLFERDVRGRQGELRYCSRRCARRASGRSRRRHISLDELGHRDRWHCHICGRKVARSEASADHVVPFSLGGSNRASNLRLAHLKCNVRRGAGRSPGQPLLLHVVLRIRRGAVP